MSNTQRVGREAIEEIKTAYMGGRTFGTSHDVRRFIIDRLGLKPEKTGVIKVRDWDRQARLEIQEHNKVSVTNPSAGNGYVRNPNAEAPERMASRKSRRQDTLTRVHNDRIEAEADAAQSDATEIEKVRSRVIATALRLLEDITGDS